jgi:hypothetical protein
MKLAYATILLAMLTQHVAASPYRDHFVGVTIEGYEWGFWRVVDYRLDPDPAKRGFYLSGRGEDSRFITYWCIGFGPYVHFQISQGLGVSAIALAAVLGGVTVYRKKTKARTEPGATPNSRPPSRLPSSPEVQSSDSLRTPSSGGCG